MALIVFLRGVNVGGHKTFRPSVLAKELGKYDVVNVGAAGTFVVRKPGSRDKFCAELSRRLPFKTTVVVCDHRDLLRVEIKNPFKKVPQNPDIVRFVSISPKKSARPQISIPTLLPAEGRWLVKIMASKDQFIFGVYRRHMKTIGYLSQIDKMFGTQATTRNWNTIMAILRILKGREIAE